MGVVRKFINLLYGSTPVEIESSFELSESIARLKAATGRTFLSGLTRQRAIGTVKESRVSLRRHIPMFGNSFKPFFIGRFIEENGRVVLIGRFTMLWPVKAFMSIWFGLSVLWTVAAFAKLAGIQTDRWWLPLFGIVMFCAGAAFVRFGKWLSRNDADWLCEVMEKALSDKIPIDDML